MAERRSFPSYNQDEVHECKEGMVGHGEIHKVIWWIRFSAMFLLSPKNLYEKKCSFSKNLKKSIYFRNLPSNVQVFSWNSKVVRANGKYLGLSNMNHNENLRGLKQLSFTFVMVGTTMRQMAGYTSKTNKQHFVDTNR